MSFYVSPTKNRWRLMHETEADGHRSAKTIPTSHYTALGFTVFMTLAEAKARASQLNLKNAHDAKKITAAARRIELTKVIESIFLPEKEAQEFSKRLVSKSFGTAAHKEKLLAHWQYVQRMITKLEIEPNDYADEANQFYQYFIEAENSLDYTKKLLKVVNDWGYFICKKRGQFFEPIPAPKGQVRERINETYEESEGFVGEADMLTPELLEARRSKLKVAGNYEWLYLSVWLGLRPPEVDALRDPATCRIEEEDGVMVVWVFQSKLSGIAREKRWKPIPLVELEQQACIEIIKNGLFKRPIYKTMWDAFENDGKITLYSGRKGFQDLMTGRDHAFEDISSWLGHQSLNTTWQKYRNRNRTALKGSRKAAK